MMMIDDDNDSIKSRNDNNDTPEAWIQESLLEKLMDEAWKRNMHDPITMLRRRMMVTTSHLDSFIIIQQDHVVLAEYSNTYHYTTIMYFVPYDDQAVATIHHALLICRH